MTGAYVTPSPWCSLSPMTSPKAVTDSSTKRLVRTHENTAAAQKAAPTARQKRPSKSCFMGVRFDEARQVEDERDRAVAQFRRAAHAAPARRVAAQAAHEDLGSALQRVNHDG